MSQVDIMHLKQNITRDISKLYFKLLLHCIVAVSNNTLNLRITMMEAADTKKRALGRCKLSEFKWRSKILVALLCCTAELLDEILVQRMIQGYKTCSTWLQILFILIRCRFSGSKSIQGYIYATHNFSLSPVLRHISISVKNWQRNAK